MSDSEAKLTFLEKRLTILERQYYELKSLISSRPAGHVSESRVEINCDAPGLLAATAYDVERPANAKSFCWMGSEGHVQIKLPVAPVRPLICKVTIKPHNTITLEGLRLFVNDAFTDYRLEHGIQNTLIIFSMRASTWPHIEVNFLDLPSVRPSDLGESEDNRLIAFRFYNAVVEYDLAAPTSEGSES